MNIPVLSDCEVSSENFLYYTTFTYRGEWRQDSPRMFGNVELRTESLITYRMNNVNTSGYRNDENLVDFKFNLGHHGKKCINIC